ncbi:MAG: hypothetical protein JO147_05070 [Actinobacteria bacterium]|nr:hypothetical protein [Actinomycetota bacterium]
MSAEHGSPSESAVGVRRRMSGRVRTLVAVVAAAGLLVAGLSGCAAGQHAATAEETPVTDGVSANVGPINIRNAAIQPPFGNSYSAGSAAALTMVIVNSGRTDDQLTSVTTSAASSATFFANGAAATAAPMPVSSSSSPATSTTRSGSSASSASSPVSGAPASSGQTSLPLPAGQSVRIGLNSNDAVIQLSGLRSELSPAQPVSITMTFKNAGSVTFTLAVRLSTSTPSAPTLATTHPETES